MAVRMHVIYTCGPRVLHVAARRGAATTEVIRRRANARTYVRMVQLAHSRTHGCFASHTCVRAYHTHTCARKRVCRERARMWDKLIPHSSEPRRVRLLSSRESRAEGDPRRHFLFFSHDDDALSSPLLRLPLCNSNGNSMK